MKSLLFVQLIISAVLLISLVWLGFFVVKSRRKEHLYWIVPSVLSRFMALFASLTSTYWYGSFPSSFVSSIYVMAFGAHIIALLSIVSLVVVIWKSMDQTSLAVDN